MRLFDEKTNKSWFEQPPAFSTYRMNYNTFPATFFTEPNTVPALLPKVELAELMPDVEMIQVEILGTVNMQIAPIKKTMITVPKESRPLLANTAIFSILALSPSSPTSSLYLLISEVMAYSCINPQRYMIR